MAGIYVMNELDRKKELRDHNRYNNDGSTFVAPRENFSVSSPERESDPKSKKSSYSGYIFSIRMPFFTRMSKETKEDCSPEKQPMLAANPNNFLGINLPSDINPEEITFFKWELQSIVNQYACKRNSGLWYRTNQYGSSTIKNLHNLIAKTVRPTDEITLEKIREAITENRKKIMDGSVHEKNGTNYILREINQRALFKKAYEMVPEFYPKT